MKSHSMPSQPRQQRALHSPRPTKSDVTGHAFRLVVLLALLLPLTDLRAEDCRSAPLPSLSRLIVTNESGSRVEFQGHIRNNMHTAHVWVDGEHRGEFELPVEFESGQFRLWLNLTLQNETWMGSVRQVQKHVPYLTVCGDWQIDKLTPRAAPSAPDFLVDGWIWPLARISHAG